MDPTVVLFIISSLCLFWLVVLTALIASEKQFLKSLSKGIAKKDLLAILKQLNQSLKLSAKQQEQADGRISHLETAIRTHLQKTGFIRFNPFSDTGGDQSFCLCLLDQENNGIVITSLHTRSNTRVYAKPITAQAINQADYSQEEWQAYQAARNAHKNN